MNKNTIIAAVLVIALLITGFVVYKAVTKPKAPAKTETSQDDSSGVDDSLPKNTSIDVTVEKSSSKDNTIVLTASKLDKKYTGIDYEVTYETKGTYQGVNSGSKPLDVTGQDEFTREVYLGTCSKNVCTPHTGISQVSIALELTDTDGNKTQFTKDYPLSF